MSKKPISTFEKEMQNEKSSPEEEKTDDFFNSLDQIVDGADHNNNDDDFLMDTLGDIPGIDDVTKTEGLSQAQTMEKEPDEQSEDTAEPAQASDDAGSDTFGMRPNGRLPFGTSLVPCPLPRTSIPNETFHQGIGQMTDAT